ncbi:hypothetical protein JYK21_03975 [Ralstonia pickettii]|nr:hypothetical protein [Ralstonia pickettii]
MSTYLSEDKLNYFRDKLNKMKAETEKLIRSSSNESPNDAIQELSDYGNHPADLGTEQFEQERDAGLESVHRERLQEINDALKRIDNKTYGISEISQKPIPEERLEAMPTARILVEEENEKANK